VDRVALAFLDHAGNVVAERAVSSASTVRLGVGFSQALAESGLSYVVKSGQARIIDDMATIKKPSVATRLILEEGFRSSLTVGLSFGTACIGFLFFNSRKPGAYRRADADLAERLAASLRVPIYHHYIIQLILAETSRSFVRSMEKRDSETGSHIERMSRYAHAIACELAKDPVYSEALRPRTLREILWFSPLHDIGKIGIPDAILFKPGPLNPEERAVMETHVEMGASIFRELNGRLETYLPPPLVNAVSIISEHHERWDGQGYPRGLRGEEISLSARIAAVADVLDALSTSRPYKTAWTLDASLDHVIAEGGRHFDPRVVQVLPALADSLREIYRLYADASIC
jgi:HD-GYP domain-containing protein (c-di-GMP phosphodiesterase class II)